MSDESVDIRIDNDDDLRSLAGWLREENEFRGRVRFGDQVVVPGQMGGFSEVLTVLISSGTAATIVKSVFAWLSVRKKSNTVSLTLKNSAGNEIVLKCGSGDEAQTLIDQVRSFFSDGV